MKLQTTLLLLLWVPLLHAQNTFFRNTVEGYYEGALIRGNSVVLLTADFYEENDTLFVESNVREWAYYDPLRSAVTVNGTVLQFRTFYGEATVVFDTVYTEMVGAIRLSSPGYEIHLKKVLRPPGPRLTVKDLSFDVGDISLKAKLVVPNGFAEPLTCAIFVQGRGCNDRNRLLRKPYPGKD